MIAEVDNVAEVAVVGEAHPFTGQVVVARVAVRSDEDARAVERRVREHCKDRLAPYMIPAKVLVVLPDELVTARDKKARRTAP